MSNASEFDEICGACYMKQSVEASGDKSHWLTSYGNSDAKVAYKASTTNTN